MLESERAGAKALVVFMDEHEHHGEPWRVLRRVQADEAHNCALIGRLLDQAGVPHSHATGGFYDKAVAVQGRRARIEYLLRGLRWAVKRFDEAMPGLDEKSRAVFAAMKETHLRSIAACESVARGIAAQ